MPTAVMTSTWHNTTDADFRQWGKAISDGIAAVGLIKVADTGTVNWATVVKPASNNSAAGFEIWRFNDPLQDTAPVFIKLEYGCQQHLLIPGTWVTVGRGSDGAGNVTGVLAPRRQTQANTAGTTLTASALLIEPIYISSDGSSLCVVPRTSAAANASRVGVVIVDRSRDSAGAPTATGGVVLTEGAASGGMSTGGTESADMHTWSYSGEYAMGQVPAVAPAFVNSTSGISASTSLASGDKAPVFPYITVLPNHAPWQVLAAMGIMAGDAANGPFTASTLGTVRDYRSIPVGDAHCRWMTVGRSSSGHTGLCILWPED